MSEEAHLAAVVGKLRAGGSNAYSVGELDKMSTLPTYFTEVQVSERWGELNRGTTPDIRLWRIVTKAVATSYVNAQRERQKVATALEGQSLSVASTDTTPVVREQSDDTIGPDGDRLSGISMWAYAI